jgi:hypothetical protein
MMCGGGGGDMKQYTNSALSAPIERDDLGSLATHIQNTCFIVDWQVPLDPATGLGNYSTHNQNVLLISIR